MNTKRIATFGAIAALWTMAGPSLAAGEGDSDALRCLSLMRVDHTSVIDNQNVLFYLRGGDIYLNHLAHPAPGLERNRPFLHQTTTGQICKSDIVTVLEEWSFGFTEGASSTFGLFEPIDAATADSMKQGKQ